MFMARITEKSMELPLVEYWTPEECSAGLCLPEDIGKARSPLVEARKLTQLATLKAVKALVEVAEQNEDLGAKVKAASMLLDRGWGKPDQHTTSDNVHQIIDMPWLTAQRHAYKLGEGAGRIIEAGLSIIDAEIKHADPALPEPGSARDSGDPVLPSPEAE
jgi:hypothetical protein